ncbi:ADP-ribosylation [Pleurotus eryngii]|uniref:ADP-ribosylation n=1 Tax=Pleurotus eryngii TaxID=5323 RepID=A0A9P5ZQ01_PLEER|nr:ADP-ribosylation [Pleurotus eryngii]
MFDELIDEIDEVFDAFDELKANRAFMGSSNKRTRLVAMKEGDHTYAHLERYFHTGWKHPNKPKPEVHRIFKVVFPEHSLKPFREYRTLIDSQLTSTTLKPLPGNESLMFHGTNRRCQIGDEKGNVMLCSLPECFLCSVLRGSYDIAKCGSKNRFKRFGTGIYTSSCSSKADDYVSNIASNSHYRVMLVNRVILGNPCIRKTNAIHLTEPPPGYHSVVGLPGADLNYEETVVYDNDAIRPAFLIVYSHEPEVRPEIHSKAMAFWTTLFKTPLAT